MNQQQFEERFASLTDRQREVLLRVLAGEKDVEIANSLHIAEATVRKHIEKICKVFRLNSQYGERSKRPELIQLFRQHKPEWVLISDTPEEAEEEETPIEDEVSIPPRQTSANFLGREDDFRELDALVDQGHKILLIHAPGGVGKTKLAWEYLQAKFDFVLELWMARETQSITSAASVVEEWLRKYFNEEPGREFGIAKERLRQKLRDSKKKIGILIDNLEPALVNGKFIEVHRQYVDLLTIFSDPEAQSITLITSRERLQESAVLAYSYRLTGLSTEAWQTFFISRNIQADLPLIDKMNKAYGGNAKAMEILSSAIQIENDRDAEEYWRVNQGDLLVDAKLRDLVISQFNRLQRNCLDTYNLLCRLGCYRYQDVPSVSLAGVLCLLWDVPESKRMRVLKSLKDCSLIEFNKEEHWLHPVIREEAISKLRASEDWETANHKAAEFWTTSVKIVESVEDALRALESYYQYVEIDQFELAIKVITTTRSNKWEKEEALGRAFYRLGLLNQIISLTSTIEFEVLSGFSLSHFYNIRANSYWQLGDMHQSIKYYSLSKEVALSFNIDRFVVNSMTGIGLCKIELLEIQEAIEVLKVNLEYGKNLREIPYWLMDTWFCLAYSFVMINLELEAKYFADKAYIQLTKNNYLNLWTKGYSFVFLGKTYRRLGEINKSFDLYTRGIKFAEDSFYNQVKAIALTGLAEIYRRQEKKLIAVSYHLESIEILQKIGAKCDLAEAYFQLALTYQEMSEAEKSQENFDKAIRLFNQIGAPKQVERVQQAIRGSLNTAW